MGQKDLTEKNLEFYPDVFADAVNALLYEGEQRLQAESLQPAPTETLYPSESGKLRNQFHDVSKYEMEQGRIRMQYTLENETRIKRKAVLRKAGYEGAVYRERYDGGEIYPFVGILLYWGDKRWRAPRSIHQMFRCDAGQKKYIDNIRLHVYEMAHLSPKTRERFRSDMRIIVDYLAKGKDYEPSDQKIMHPEALLRMLGALTGDDRYEGIIPAMREEEKKGGISMCELLDKYENRGREAGRKAGRKAGMKAGKKAGMARGIERVNELIRRLIGDGRSGEIVHAVSDREYQERLFAEYGL